MTTLPNDAGPVLLGLARSSIASALGQESRESVENPTDAYPWLAEPGASFVTLTINGSLRGCIGSLTAWRPLDDDVRDNAQAAAFDDPRFTPLTQAEYGSVHIEVSVLSRPEPMTFTTKQDALAQLRPGIDGVVLLARGRRATFLPQVWEELPSPEQFIAHLLRKAGLPPTYWDDDVTLERYTVTAFEED